MNWNWIVPFEIPHKISDPYIESAAFYLDVKLQELLESDIKAKHKKRQNQDMIGNLIQKITEP